MTASRMIEKVQNMQQIRGRVAPAAKAEAAQREQVATPQVGK